MNNMVFSIGAQAPPVNKPGSSVSTNSTAESSGTSFSEIFSSQAQKSMTESKIQSKNEYQKTSSEKDISYEEEIPGDNGKQQQSTNAENTLQGYQAAASTQTNPQKTDSTTQVKKETVATVQTDSAVIKQAAKKINDVKMAALDVKGAIKETFDKIKENANQTIVNAQVNIQNQSDGKTQKNKQTDTSKTNIENKSQKDISNTVNSKTTSSNTTFSSAIDEQMKSKGFQKKNSQINKTENNTEAVKQSETPKLQNQTQNKGVTAKSEKPEAVEDTLAKNVIKTKIVDNQSAQSPPINIEKSTVIVRSSEIYGLARSAEARNLTPTVQIVRNIETMIKEGQTSMRVQLYPENMGKIELQLTSTSNGMTVTLVPDVSSTGKLLESQLSELRYALTDAGIELNDLNVGQDKSQYPDENKSQNRRKSNAAFLGLDLGNATELDQAIGTLDGISLLDYRV